MIDDIRSALGLLRRAERWQWAALVPLAAIGAATEALGAAAVFFLARVLTDPAQASRIPIASSWVGPPGATEPQVLFRATALVVAFYVVRNVLLISIQSIQERVVHRTASRLATRLLSACLNAPYPFHFRRASSSLITDLRYGVDLVVAQVIASVLHLASELMVVVGLLVILALAAPAATVLALAAMCTILVPLIVISRRLMGRLGEQDRQINERISADLDHSLGAIKAILLGGLQPHFIARFERNRVALSHVREHRETMTLGLRLTVETAFICAMLIAVALLTLSGRSGPEVVSLLGLYAYAGFRMVPSANRVMVNLNSLRYGRAFVTPLAEDWAFLGQSRPVRRPEAVAPFARDIVFDQVSYVYEDDRPHALRGVNLTIARGESVGIVGPSGAGKSTLVDVMLGLLPPTSGRVLVDGRDIAAALPEWQRQIGYVPQDPAIVDDTLRRNVAFGLDDDAIEEARVVETIRIARLTDLAASLPRGLDTRLGQRGIRLSGGERQRIAIARALYRDPAVLVFDEATSALDDQTEREIVDAIDALRGRTIVVIAHRASTVRSCDRLVMLDQGRVVSMAGQL